MKVYLAGPMTGRVDHNFPAFREAEHDIIRLGHIVFVSPAIWEDTAFVNAHPRSFHMRRDIEMLLRAEAVVVLDGWEDSTGARLEVAIAKELELPVYTMATLLQCTCHTAPMDCPKHGVTSVSVSTQTARTRR